MKKFTSLLFVLLLSGLAWPVSEYGQLSGVITDDQGSPLPGASIVIESDALIGGPRTQLSNESGNFIFIQLRPGEYTVTCQMEGFQGVKNEKVRVNLDRTTQLIIQLQMAGEFQETVVVTGAAPVVDPTQTNIGRVFDETYLQETAIGAGGRSYQSVLAQTGGVVGAGNVSVFGSAGDENNYLIDGLSTTDPVTGTFGTNFNFDAIQEISFQTGGFEAEYGQATGGIVNVVTKSGSNTFDGSFDIRYSDESFQEGSDDYPPWSPYDPSKEKTWFYNPAFSLGGPILKDKVWFFLSVQDTQSEYTPAGAPYAREWDGQNYMGKVTWQIGPNDTLIGKWASDPAEIRHANASISVMPEATYTQSQGGDIYQLDYSRILSESLLFTAKAGVNNQYLDAYPTSKDLVSPPYYDRTYGISYNNSTVNQYSGRDRSEFQTSLTWFKNNWLGDHTFKVGGNFNDVTFDWYAFTPGDRYYVTLDWDGDGTSNPYYKYVFSHEPPEQYTGKIWSAYLQDEWKILPNLVFKPGLRYDAVAYKNNVGTEVADLSTLQPRIGLAWDVFSNAKTVVRGYYGTFMHPSTLDLPSFLREGESGYDEMLHSAYLANAYGMTPEEVCEYFGPCDDEGYIVQRTQHFEDGYPVDPNLKPTVAHQWSIGFEQEIAPRTGIELTYVQKRTKYFMDDTCYGYDEDGNFIDPADYADQPDTWGDWGDVGPQGRYCQGFMVRNPTGATRYFYGYILKLESRYKDWFHLMIDYTYSKAYEWVGDSYFGATDFDAPWHYVNRYGYGSGDNRHYVKAGGYFFLPAKFTVGFNAFYRTGRPYNKIADTYSYQGEDSPPPPEWGTLYLEPKGTYRLNSLWWVDLQVSWSFRIAEGINAKAIASVNNLFNKEPILGRCSYWNSTDPNEEGAGDGACGGVYDQNGDIYWFNWGDPYAWMSPRSYEVGLRIEF